MQKLIYHIENIKCLRINKFLHQAQNLILHRGIIMQLQGFIFMIFIFVILPIFILFSNHTVFFIAISFILLINSLRQIYFSILGIKQLPPDIEEEDKEFIDSVESSTGFNLKLFDTGTKVTKYLIAILFYVYCSLFIKNMIVNVLISTVIVYWIYNIIRSIRESNNINSFLPIAFERIINLIASSSSACIIAIIAYIKMK